MVEKHHRVSLETPYANGLEEDEETGYTITSTCGYGTYRHFPGRFCRPVRKPELLNQLDDYTWWSFVSQVNEELRNQTFWIYACVFTIAFYAIIMYSAYVRWLSKQALGELLLRDTILLDMGWAFMGVLIISTGIFLTRQSQELHAGLAEAANKWSQAFYAQGYEVEYVHVETPTLFFVTLHESQLVFRRCVGARPRPKPSPIKPKTIEVNFRELLDPIEPPPIVMKNTSRSLAHKPTPQSSMEPPPIVMKNTSRSMAHKPSPKSSMEFPDPSEASDSELLPAKKLKKKRTYLKI